MTPTLNVNLKPCRCQEPKKRAAPCEPGRHRPECGGPVLIPCPLPPKVEFTVRLGECDCNPGLRGSRGKLAACAVDCPARPIKVTCTIGGETWEGSEVTDVNNPNDDQGRWGAGTGDVWRAAVAACRDRWALVRALVLGHTDLSALLTGPMADDLLARRDAVFAALAKMVQAEQAAIAAQAECDAAFPIDTYVKVPAPDHRAEPRPSAVRLAAYVSHLIASVGDLA